MKNTLRVLLLVSLIFCLSPKARAISGGTGVSDGGHGVVCGAQPSAVRLLDALEAEAMNTRFAIDPEPWETTSNEPFFEHFEDVSEVVLAHASEALGDDHPFVISLRKQLRLSRAYFSQGLMVGVALRQTYDYGPIDVQLDPSCQIVQLAERTEVSASSSLVFDLEYWPKLPMGDREGLIVHEALHPWFAPEVSTKAVRQANIYLFASDDFRAAHRREFKWLVETRAPQTF